jgi:hypothetical protein
MKTESVTVKHKAKKKFLKLKLTLSRRNSLLVLKALQSQQPSGQAEIVCRMIEESIAKKWPSNFKSHYRIPPYRQGEHPQEMR